MSEVDHNNKMEKQKLFQNRNEYSNSFFSSLCICFSDIKNSLKLLKTAPHTLWVTFILKFISSYSYFSFSLNLIIYLSDDFNYSDQTAGWYYGIYGILVTIYGFICGFAVDYAGVKITLGIGSILCMIGRFIMAFTVSKFWLYFSLFLISPIGEALGIPVMTIAIRRVTDEQNRKQAYGLFYTFMNIAALLTGGMTDFFRSMYSGDKNNVNEISQWSPSRLVFITGATAQILMLLIIVKFYNIREHTFQNQSNGSEEGGNSNSIENETEQRNNGFFNKIKQTCSVVFREKDFWRLVVCSGFLIGVKLIFRHMDATLPKYMIREMGKDAKFGLIYSINPFLIILLVPLISAYAVKICSFSMIYYGSWLASLSPFCLIFGSSYSATIAFMIILSLGEAVYSPPTYQYSMELAPEGQEGMYTTLANAPLFAAQILTGALSGYLLENLCPAEGPRNCSLMWLIIGLITLTSPILMTVFRFFIDPKMFRKNNNLQKDFEIHSYNNSNRKNNDYSQLE